MQNIDQSTKLSFLRQRLEDLMVEDIKKASHMRRDCSGYYDDRGRDEIVKVIPDYSGGSMVGGFILGLHAIQVLSKLAYDGNDGEAFGKFVKVYMPKYKAIPLYELRNSLFKEYGVYYIGHKGKSRFVLVAMGKQRHLKKINGETHLNLENFVEDIESAFIKFFDDPKKNVKRLIDHADKQVLKEPTTYRIYNLN